MGHTVLTTLRSVFGMAIFGASLATGAPAYAQETTDSADALEAPRCVRLVNINGYSVIDRNHLILNGGASRHYLVTTRNSCSAMRFGARLGFTFGDNARICRPFIENIITPDGGRCSIETIEDVEDREAALRLIDARAAAQNAENEAL